MGGSAECSSKPKVFLRGAVGEVQVDVGREDESLRGSKLFIPETERRKEFVDSALPLRTAFLGERSDVNMATLIEGRDLCRRIVRPSSVWGGVEI